MKKQRVFKLKTFARWAKKILTDAQLCAAAQEIWVGQYEAALGGGVCKKRIAIPGRANGARLGHWWPKAARMGFSSWPGAQKVTLALIFQRHRWRKPN